MEIVPVTFAHYNDVQQMESLVLIFMPHYTVLFYNKSNIL